MTFKPPPRFSPPALVTTFTGRVGLRISRRPLLSAICKLKFDSLQRAYELNAPNSVEAFFSFHPHAGKLFHVPTFMASIDLPPTHPNFPSPAIIHAICAVGSLYTVAVPPTPPPEKSMVSEDANLGGGSSDHSPLADEIFGNWYKRKDYIDSFAERHVKLAKQTAEEQLWAGKKLLEDVQGGNLTVFIIQPEC